MELSPSPPSLLASPKEGLLAGRRLEQLQWKPGEACAAAAPTFPARD